MHGRLLHGRRRRRHWHPCIGGMIPKGRSETVGILLLLLHHWLILQGIEWRLLLPLLRRWLRLLL